MAFSGYAAGGAVTGLEELFASQLKEELEREEMARLQEEREAQRAFREQDLNMRGEEMRQRTAIANREEARHASTEARAVAEAQRKADAEAHKQTALHGMSEMVNQPGLRNVLREHAVASGVDLPNYIEESLKPPELVPFDTVDAKGNRVRRYLEKNSPEATTGVRSQPPQYQPQYEWVTGADGQPMRVRSDRPSQPGEVPYDKTQGGAGGAGTEAQQAREQRRQAAAGTVGLLETISKGIHTGSGLEQKWDGFVRDLKGQAGYDPRAAVYNTLKGSAGATLAVAVMGAQNLSDTDRKIWDEMIPGTGVDERTAKALFTYLNAYLASKPAPNLHGGSSQPPPDLMQGVLQVLETGKAPPVAASQRLRYDPATGEMVPVEP